MTEQKNNGETSDLPTFDGELFRIPTNGLDYWYTEEGRFAIHPSLYHIPAFNRDKVLPNSDPNGPDRDRLRCWMELLEECRVGGGKTIERGNMRYELLTSELLGGRRNLARLWGVTDYAAYKFLGELEEAGFIGTHSPLGNRSSIVRIEPTRREWLGEPHASTTPSPSRPQGVRDERLFAMGDGVKMTDKTNRPAEAFDLPTYDGEFFFIPKTVHSNPMFDPEDPLPPTEPGGPTRDRLRVYLEELRVRHEAQNKGGVS